MLQPYPAEEMKTYPVSTLIGNVKNDVPECIEEIKIGFGVKNEGDGCLLAEKWKFNVCEEEVIWGSVTLMSKDLFVRIHKPGDQTQENLS